MKALSQVVLAVTDSHDSEQSKLIMITFIECFHDTAHPDMADRMRQCCIRHWWLHLVSYSTIEVKLLPSIRSPQDYNEL